LFSVCPYGITNVLQNQMKKLFGTDGIRAKAGEFPLDEKTITIVGASLARLCRERLGRTPRFITGRDTRESGEGIEAAFHRGAKSAGAECLSAGVITTPGVAFVTGYGDFDGGIVISASHNPFEDNGLKIFNPSGKKAQETTEREIEKDIHEGNLPEFNGNSGSVDNSREVAFKRAYVDHLAEFFKGLDLAGRRIIVDCANGASSKLAPELFVGFGADVEVINCKPDGRNINANCGSMHLEVLQGKMRGSGADLGVAFDGDADRALFVDESGEIVDGDAVLWVMAKYFIAHGKLANKKVIATVMSNLGLELALKSRAIELVRTAVGDKYVLDELIASGSEVGGEQSGHIIFPEKSLVGDGMLTALNLMKASTELGGTLSQAIDGFVRYPQILVNVKVKEKRPFDEVAAIREAAGKIEHQMNGNGRLLLRYSGTENLARVMMEGKDQKSIEDLAHSLAGVIREELG
jgi:phosphoglucosamine mutase